MTDAFLPAAKASDTRTEPLRPDRPQWHTPKFTEINLTATQLGATFLADGPTGTS